MIPNETLTLFQLHGWTVHNMNLIISKANGSTFKEISKTNFRALPILIGSGISEYIMEVENYYAQIESNLLENQTLTQLRDTLLPKLISGEVRVKDVEKTLTEVL
jgi:type I restriction enzyme S subunit